MAPVIGADAVLAPKLIYTAAQAKTLYHAD
jgi:hypothetical protein